jgi:hypothetical protein
LKKDAVLGVLLENPGHLTAIFRALARLGCLGAVLDLLDVRASRALWTGAVAPPAREAEPAEFRVFVRAALEIIEALGLWTGEPVEEERLLGAYVAAHPPLPHWTDRRSLALAVMHVLRFAQRRRWLVLPLHPTAEAPAPALAETLARLDWLDTAWLAASISEWFIQTTPTASGTLPARRTRQTATPTQQRLLERLRQILRARVVTLDFQVPKSESNALRLYAALAAAEPELAVHPAARSIIVLLLAAWKLILESGEALELPGRPIENLFDLPFSSAHHTLRAVAALGEPAAELLTALIAQSAEEAAESREGSIETSCAGLFLLLRAITEVRLQQIITSRNVGPLPAILLGFGIHWAGPSAIRGGAPDPGLALWCGLSGPPRPVAETLAQLDTSRCGMLLARILEIVESLSAMHPSLHADEMPDEWRAVLTEGWPSAVQRIPALEVAAAHLLCLWARWLPGIGHSGPPYLLKNLIRRSGRIEIHDEFVRVAMTPAPLDAVLEMSAYLGEIPAIPWLGDRRVSLRIVRGTR